jgi:hypothetical protein
MPRTQPYDQPHHHPRKDGYDRLVHCPDALDLEVVRSDECADEEDAEDAEAPSGVSDEVQTSPGMRAAGPSCSRHESFKTFGQGRTAVEQAWEGGENIECASVHRPLTRHRTLHLEG